MQSNIRIDLCDHASSLVYNTDSIDDVRAFFGGRLPSKSSVDDCKVKPICVRDITTGASRLKNVIAQAQMSRQSNYSKCVLGARRMGYSLRSSDADCDFESKRPALLSQSEDVQVAPQEEQRIPTVLPVQSLDPPCSDSLEEQERNIPFMGRKMFLPKAIFEQFKDSPFYAAHLLNWDLRRLGLSTRFVKTVGNAVDLKDILDSARRRDEWFRSFSSLDLAKPVTVQKLYGHVSRDLPTEAALADASKGAFVTAVKAAIVKMPRDPQLYADDAAKYLSTQDSELVYSGDCMTDGLAGVPIIPFEHFVKDVRDIVVDLVKTLDKTPRSRCTMPVFNAVNSLGVFLVTDPDFTPALRMAIALPYLIMAVLAYGQLAKKFLYVIRKEKELTQLCLLSSVIHFSRFPQPPVVEGEEEVRQIHFLHRSMAFLASRAANYNIWSSRVADCVATLCVGIPEYLVDPLSHWLSVHVSDPAATMLNMLQSRWSDAIVLDTTILTRIVNVYRLPGTDSVALVDQEYDAGTDEEASAEPSPTPQRKEVSDHCPTPQFGSPSPDAVSIASEDELSAQGPKGSSATSLGTFASIEVSDLEPPESDGELEDKIAEPTGADSDWWIMKPLRRLYEWLKSLTVAKTVKSLYDQLKAGVCKFFGAFTAGVSSLWSMVSGAFESLANKFQEWINDLVGVEIVGQVGSKILTTLVLGIAIAGLVYIGITTFDRLSSVVSMVLHKYRGTDDDVHLVAQGDADPEVLADPENGGRLSMIAPKLRHVYNVVGDWTKELLMVNAPASDTARAMSNINAALALTRSVSGLASSILMSLPLWATWWLAKLFPRSKVGQMHRSFDLYTRGLSLRAVCTNAQMLHDKDYNRALSKWVSDANDLLSESSELKLGNLQSMSSVLGNTYNKLLNTTNFVLGTPEPLGVCWIGPAGTFKSTAITTVINSSARLPRPESHGNGSLPALHVNLNSSFCDGLQDYTRILVFDDALSVIDPVNASMIVSSLLQIVSPTVYIPNLPSLEPGPSGMKGTVADLDYVFLSTNVDNFGEGSTYLRLADQSAFTRRFKFIKAIPFPADGVVYESGRFFKKERVKGARVPASKTEMKDSVLYLCGYYDEVAPIVKVVRGERDAANNAVLQIASEHFNSGVAKSFMSVGSNFLCGFDRLPDVVREWGKAHFEENPWADSARLTYKDIEPYTSDPAALVRFVEEQRLKYNISKVDKLWKEGPTAWSEVEPVGNAHIRVDESTHRVIAWRGNVRYNTPFYNFENRLSSCGVVFEANMKRLFKYCGMEYTENLLATILSDDEMQADFIKEFVAHGGDTKEEVRLSSNLGLALDEDGNVDSTAPLYTLTRGQVVPDVAAIDDLLSDFKGTVVKSEAWKVQEFLRAAKGVGEYYSLTPTRQSEVLAVFRQNLEAMVKKLDSQACLSYLSPSSPLTTPYAYPSPSQSALGGTSTTLANRLFTSCFGTYSSPFGEFLNDVFQVKLGLIRDTDDADLLTDVVSFCSKCGCCVDAHVGYTHECGKCPRLALATSITSTKKKEQAFERVAKLYVACCSLFPKMYPAFADIGTGVWRRVVALLVCNTTPMMLGGHAPFISIVKDPWTFARGELPKTPEPVLASIPSVKDYVEEEPSWFASVLLPTTFFSLLTFGGLWLFKTMFSAARSWMKGDSGDESEAASIDPESEEADFVPEYTAQRYKARSRHRTDSTTSNAQRAGRSEDSLKYRAPRVEHLKPAVELVAQGTESVSAATLLICSGSGANAPVVHRMHGFTGYKNYFVTYCHAVDSWEEVLKHPEYVWRFKVYSGSGNTITYNATTSQVDNVLRASSEDIVAVQSSVLPERCGVLERLFMPISYYHLNMAKPLEFWKDGERSYVDGVITTGRAYGSRSDGSWIRTPQYSISYHHYTKPGDCGSLIVLRGTPASNIGLKVAGIHVAGNERKESPSGMAILVSLEMASTLFGVSRIKQPEEVIAEPLYDLVEQAPSDNVDYAESKGVVGYVTGLTYHIPTKSAFKRSPFADVTTFPQQRHPAILSENDPRNVTHASPFQYTVRLLIDTERENMSVDPSCYAKACQEVYKEFDAALVDPVGVIPLGTVVAGVPGSYDGLTLSTSAGYPYVIAQYTAAPSRRRDLIDRDLLEYHPVFKDRLDDLISYLKGDGPLPDVSVVSFPKDELVKQKKIDSVATRCIECFPLDVLVATKMYCGRFIEAFNHCYLKTSSCVGLNMTSTDANEIARRVTNDFQWSHIIAGDYSKFDCSYSRQLLVSVYSIIYKLAGLDVMGFDFDRFFALYVDLPAQFGDEVYYFRSAHYSGGPFTTIVNILANDILIRTAYYQLGGDCFDAHVRCCFLGDDNLIGTDVDTDWFNLEVLSTQLAQYGFVYTNAAKEDVVIPEDLDHAEFMGCFFRKVGGWYFGALRKESLENIGYVRNDDETFYSKMYTFMVYSAAWGEEYFNAFVAELTRCSGLTSELFFPVPYWEAIAELRGQAVIKPYYAQSAINEFSEPALVIGTDTAELEDGQIVVSTGITTAPMTIERGLASFIPRGTFTWNASFSKGAALHYFSGPFDPILNDATTLQGVPFSRFSYYRGRLLVRVVANAPTTTPGRAMIVYNKFSNERPTLTEAALCPSVVFDPSAQQAAELSIPFEYNREVVSLASMPTLGTIFFLVLSPVVGDAQVACTWYTAYADVSFYQPSTPRLVAQSDLPDQPVQQQAPADPNAPVLDPLVANGGAAKPSVSDMSAHLAELSASAAKVLPTKPSRPSRKERRRLWWKKNGARVRKGQKTKAQSVKPQPNKKERVVRAQDLPPKVQKEVREKTREKKRGSRPFNRRRRARVGGKKDLVQKPVETPSTTPTFKSVADIISHVTSGVGGVVKDKATIENFLKLTKTFLGTQNAALAVEDLKAIGEVFTSSDAVLRQFFDFIPLDNRPVFDAPQATIPKMPSLTDVYVPRSVLGFSAMPRVIHEAGRLVFNPEELNIQSICEVESLLCTFTWDVTQTAGQALLVVDLSRNLEMKGNFERYSVPVGMTLMSMFEFATFVPHFRLCAVKTKFHTGRLSVSVAHGQSVDPDEVDGKIFLTNIISLDPDVDDYEFSVPWNATQGWYTNASASNSTYSLDAQQGKLVIRVNNPLLCTSDIVGSSVDMQLYVSFSDVHVAMPASHPGGVFTSLPVSCQMKAQSGVDPDPMVEIDDAVADFEVEPIEVERPEPQAGKVMPFGQFPYCETNILEVARRMVNITLKPSGSETLHGLEYDRYAVIVTPRTIFNDLYVAWCGSLVFRFWVSTTSTNPCFVTYSPDNGASPNAVVDAHMVASVFTQQVTASAGQKTLSANANMTVPSAVEMLTPLAPGIFFGEYVVPYTTNLSYLFTPRQASLVGPQYPTANGVVTLHVPKDSVAWAWQACGDDFVYGMIAPATQVPTPVVEGAAGVVFATRVE